MTEAERLQQNIKVRREVAQVLEELLQMATKPAFRGRIVVEVESKLGRLNPPKSSLIRFGGTS